MPYGMLHMTVRLPWWGMPLLHIVLWWRWLGLPLTDQTVRRMSGLVARHMRIQGSE